MFSKWTSVLIGATAPETLQRKEVIGLFALEVARAFHVGESMSALAAGSDRGQVIGIRTARGVSEAVQQQIKSSGT